MKNKELVTIVAVSRNYYGAGPTIAEAKKKLKKAGGNLRDKYVLYLFPIGGKLEGVDPFGNIVYSWPSEPVVLKEIARIDK